MGSETEIDDVIAFYYKGSVNDDDEFYFETNSVKYELTGAEWQYFELPIPAGENVFKWVFSRKSNADEGSASLDLIKLPPMHIQFDAVEETTAISNSVAIYPNPGKNVLNVVTSDDNTAKLQVFDFQGRIILEKDITNGMTTISTETWPAGLYFWKVGKEAGKWIKSE